MFDEPDSNGAPSALAVPPRRNTEVDTCTAVAFVLHSLSSSAKPGAGERGRGKKESSVFQPMRGHVEEIRQI